MQNLAFTHLNLFNGKLDSDLQKDVTILVAFETRGEAAGGTITHIGPAAEIEIPLGYREIDLSGR